MKPKPRRATHAASMRRASSAAVMAVLVVIAVTAAAAVGADMSAEPAAQSSRLAMAASEPPAYVETVTFAKYQDDASAVDAMISGEIDMYYDSLLAPEIQRVRAAGHDIYETTSGVSYLMYINPTDDFTNGFNPFAYREVRFALNYMIDRDDVVENVLGSGAPMLSPLHAAHPDYLLVYRELESLGISYDPARAESMIAAAIIPEGASKASGTWQYNGQPITINMVIRADDPVRLQVGNRLADGLQDMGFEVSRTHANLLEAFYSVFAVDPAGQEWHIYTDAWTTAGRTVGYDNVLLGARYAPWQGDTPGFGEEHFWNYQNATLDQVTRDLHDEMYGSPEERAALVSQATRLGVEEAVLVYVANGYDAYPVRSEVSGVVASSSGGITNRYTPINVQISGGETSLEIGVRHVVQSSWNPVGGFGDSYSADVWGVVRDYAFVRNPGSLELLDGRNALVSLETAGPDGRLAVHPDAVMWSTQDGGGWVPTNETEAANRIVLDLRLANWHHGQPMDINDFLYRIAFNAEYDDGADGAPSLGGISDMVAIRVLDPPDTIEVYTDYWNPDESEIVERAGFWPSVPWEIVAAMDAAVAAGQADWYSAEAHHHSGNWLDMLDGADAGLIRGHLAEFMGNASHPYNTPGFLYENRTSEYAADRYAAAISWIDSKGHMAISNGPFVLDAIERQEQEQGGDGDGDGDAPVTRVVLDRFDDPTYPFARGHWASFADIVRLSGTVEFGSLAPITGGAFRYGIESQAAAELATSDFNEYLASHGEKWSLRAIQYDTRTDPAGALEALRDLDARGVGLVYGPTIDMYTEEVLSHARQSGMVMISCCASTPSAAIAGDGIFRMLPDMRMHADAAVRLVAEQVPEDIRYVSTIGIDSPWATELIDSARTGFESRGLHVSDDIIKFSQPVDSDISAAVEMLAQDVERAASMHGGASRVAVLYVGFAEGPLVLKEASTYDMLGDVRWFGADHNTASPNVADDPESAAFAQRVSYTVVQPSAPHVPHLTDRIHDYLESRGITPSAYSSYAYDAVWLLGLSILEAQSADPADVLPQIEPTAALYVGAIGSAKLNENGDLEEGQYQSWIFENGRWAEYVQETGGAPRTVCR